MQNSIIIFENTLLAHKDRANELLGDLSYNLAYSLLNSKQISLSELLNAFLQVLKKLDLLSEANVVLILKALIKARVSNEEKKLFTLLDELDLLRSKIENQKNFIKNEISKSFFELQKESSNSEFKIELSNSLNEALLFEAETLGILKETAESAFITTLEKGEDIELTSSEISKNLIYSTICEGNFEKERILKGSQIILKKAFELANENNKTYAKELCKGVIKGIQEGIFLGIEKFKKSFSYAVIEEDLSLKEKELVGLDEDFIKLLKNLCKDTQEPVKSIVQDLLNNELDTIFAKFKRLMNESSEQLKLSLNTLKKNAVIDDFSRLAQNKIYIFKKELSELERSTSEKYNKFNITQAKTLGFSLWEKAKKLIKK